LRNSFSIGVFWREKNKEKVQCGEKTRFWFFVFPFTIFFIIEYLR